MPPRVMIVEDDEVMLLLLQYNIEAAGYRVHGCTRGDEVAEQVAADRPDLVILNWTLPGISGLQLCRRVRGLWCASSLPILMLTARSDPADRDYALRLGVNEYICKPFSFGVLLPRVRRLLESRALLAAE